MAWAVDESLPGSFSPECFNGCPGSVLADDIQLHPGSGHKLISYQTYTQARNVIGATAGCLTDEPLGTKYSVLTQLWTTASGGACVPDTVIAGLSCECVDVGEVLPGGSGADICLCEPNGGLQVEGNDLPTGDPSGATGQCGVDFFIGVQTTLRGAGVSLSTNDQEQFLGGPALDDDFGISVMAFEDCDVTGDTGVPLGTWGFGAFSAPTVTDGRGMLVCTTPIGACCGANFGCEEVAEKDCDGTYQGDNTLDGDREGTNSECADGDPDGDGFYFDCDNCPNTSNSGQEDCDGNGVGDACDTEIDSDGDGCCDSTDACPNDPNKCADAGFCGCGETDIDADGDGCYDGPTCTPFDGCPADVNKCAPGVCGCGSSHDDGKDNDGDGFLNCVDQCAGADDAVFAPGCKGAIPTVSEWGLVILALLLLAAGKVYFGRRSATA
jgi:hypothetical protein